MTETATVAKKTAGPSMKLMKKNPTPAAVAADANPVEAEAAPAAVTEAVTEAVTKVKVKTAEQAQVESTAETVAEDDLIVKTAHEIENLKEDKAFKLIPTLMNNIDHDGFRLGGVLSVIQSQGWFMNKGYENFRAYVEAECGIQYRKAMYLIQIYNGLVESGVQWHQVGHLGWTKLKELAPILTFHNVDEWVGVAENMTVLQLQEHIKAASAGTESGSSPEKADADTSKKTTTLTFKLQEDQKTTIREALDKCKHETGTEFDAVALEAIALDYMGGESKLKKIPTLVELMTGKSPEEVLEAFGEVFPDVGIEATLPD